MNFAQLLKTNRSYRRFHEEERIERQTLVDLVALTRLCPSADRSASAASRRNMRCRSPGNHLLTAAWSQSQPRRRTATVAKATTWTRRHALRKRRRRIADSQSLTGHCRGDAIGSAGLSGGRSSASVPPSALLPASSSTCRRPRMSRTWSFRCLIWRYTVVRLTPNRLAASATLYQRSGTTQPPS